MPVITVEAMPMTTDAKRELVAALTQEASRIMNVPETSIYVFIRENPFDDIGVAGKLLSDIKNKDVSKK